MQAAASAPDDKKAELMLESIRKEVTELHTEAVRLLKILQEKTQHEHLVTVLRHVETPDYYFRFNVADKNVHTIRDEVLVAYRSSMPTPADIPELEQHYETIKSNIDKIIAMHEKYIKLKFKYTVIEVRAQTQALTLGTRNKIQTSNDEKEISTLLATLKAQKTESIAASNKPGAAMGVLNVVLIDWDEERRLAIYNNVAIQMFDDWIKEGERKIAELIHKKLLALKYLPYTKLENARVDIQNKLIEFKEELLKKIEKIYADEKKPGAMPPNLREKLNTLWLTEQAHVDHPDTYKYFTNTLTPINFSKGVAPPISEIEVAIKKYIATCNLIQLLELQDQKLNDMGVLQGCMLRFAYKLKSYDDYKKRMFRMQWNQRHTDPEITPDNASVLLSTKTKISDSGESLVKSINKILSNTTGLLTMPEIEALIVNYQQYLHGKIKNIDGLFARLTGSSDGKTYMKITLPTLYIKDVSNAEDKLLLLKTAFLQQLARMAESRKTVSEKITTITNFLNRVPSALIAPTTLEDKNFSDDFNDDNWAGAIAMRNQIRQFTVAEIIALPRKNTDPKADSKGKDFLTQLNRILLMTAYATNSDEKAYKTALESGSIAFFPLAPATTTASGAVPGSVVAAPSAGTATAADVVPVSTPTSDKKHHSK